MKETKEQEVKSGTLEHGTSVSLIVPTFQRPDFLYRCLSSIALQSVLPAEVLVGIRSDDASSRQILQKFSGPLEVKAIESKGVGVVGSMNSCLAEAKGDLIGLVDDDVELPPEWLKTMICHLETHPDVAGAGGRDFLMDHPAMRRAEPRRADVGRFHWYGRMTGNQYRGSGGPRKVDVLRGSNCLYRGDFLRRVGFDKDLRGQGAQVHWEVALALQARRLGRRLFYDPEIEVLHHVAPRLDGDQLHRGRFSPGPTVDMAFNETFVMLKHGSGVVRVTGVLWQLLVGSPHCPGILTMIRSAIKSKALGLARIRATLKGRLLACLAVTKSRYGNRPAAGEAATPQGRGQERPLT